MAHTQYTNSINLITSFAWMRAFVCLKNDVLAHVPGYGVMRSQVDGGGCGGGCSC